MPYMKPTRTVARPVGSQDNESLSSTGLTAPTIAGRKMLYIPQESTASSLHSIIKDTPTPEKAEDIYLQQAGALREAIARMYGYTTSGQIGDSLSGAAGRTEPLDPIVNLQNALMRQYFSGKGPMQESQTQGYLDNILKQRNISQNRLLSSQAAAIGAPGLYQGAINANQAARDTLTNQAMSAYRPIQAQMEREFQQQEQQLLSAITEAEREEEAAIRGMGRGSTIKDFDPELFDWESFISDVGEEVGELGMSAVENRFKDWAFNTIPMGWYTEALGPMTTDLAKDVVRRSVSLYPEQHINWEALGYNPGLSYGDIDLDEIRDKIEAELAYELGQELPPAVGGGSGWDWYDNLNPANWDWESLNPGSWF